MPMWCIPRSGKSCMYKRMTDKHYTHYITGPSVCVCGHESLLVFWFWQQFLLPWSKNCMGHQPKCIYTPEFSSHWAPPSTNLHTATLLQLANKDYNTNSLVNCWYSVAVLEMNRCKKNAIINCERIWENGYLGAKTHFWVIYVQYKCNLMKASK